MNALHNAYIAFPTPNIIFMVVVLLLAGAGTVLLASVALVGSFHRYVETASGLAEMSPSQSIGLKKRTALGVAGFLFGFLCLLFGFAGIFGS